MSHPVHKPRDWSRLIIVLSLCVQLPEILGCQTVAQNVLIYAITPDNQEQWLAAERELLTRRPRTPISEYRVRAIDYGDELVLDYQMRPEFQRQVDGGTERFVLDSDFQVVFRRRQERPAAFRHR